MSYTKEFSVWKAMKKRCSNPNNSDFPIYGGQGIRVCPRWRESFENFFHDMGKVPPGCTLDRIDNDGDYCPENCKWASKTEQSRNRRNSRFFKYKGETRCIADWANVAGINRSTLYGRLNKGWPIDRALSQGVR
jgi:hypothetical protein